VTASHQEKMEEVARESLELETKSSEYSVIKTPP
jgi:hypothetical protein